MLPGTVGRGSVGKLSSDGCGMEENDFEERHFTEAERAQAEITESGNPRKPEGEDGKNAGAHE